MDPDTNSFLRDPQNQSLSPVRVSTTHHCLCVDLELFESDLDFQTEYQVRILRVSFFSFHVKPAQQSLGSGSETLRSPTVDPN